MLAAVGWMPAAVGWMAGGGRQEMPQNAGATGLGFGEAEAGTAAIQPTASAKAAAAQLFLIISAPRI